MRKPEGGGGGGGSSSSNSWGSGLCEKSCRLLQKWTSSTTKKKKTSSYLKGRNVISSTKFGEDEDDLIIKLHALLGNRWSLIAGRLPGRTDNEVKNYWNSHLRRKLQTKGIDPDRRRSLSQTVIPSTKATPKSYNDQVSDAVSSFSADYGTISPMNMPTDLNLELTLSTMNPSPSSLISSCRFTETDQQHVDHQFKVGNMDHDHQFMKNETLVLFR